MFYEKQPEKNRQAYKDMLNLIGELSRIFSESDCPYLPYRAHENIFCKYLEADNLARSDCSADAKKNSIGIGLKTWMGNDDQKVAEFGKLKKNYTGLTGLELVKTIAEYRNERIRVTKNLHGISEMIYHVVKRVPHAMQILECAFDPIDIDNIELIDDKGNDNNTYFTDGNHTYHFSVSKNTLYMIFDDLQLLDSFNVSILGDPYTVLVELIPGKDKSDFLITIPSKEMPLKQANPLPQLCLPLYSVNKKGKFVAEKSGLNQWNAGGRKRDPDEVYIPYQKVDRSRNESFFPPRDTHFTLHLPDGSDVVAKVCQEADPNNPAVGKAIMSSPNKILGKWLLRDVFELPEGTLVTYDMLEKFGIDSVVFTKNADLDYSVDFSEIGTYEEFYDNPEEEDA
jgi:hypothetical protein